MIEKGGRCLVCGSVPSPDISSYKVSLEALGALMRQMATTESTDTLVTTVRQPDIPCRATMHVHSLNPSWSPVFLCPADPGLLLSLFACLERCLCASPAN